MNVLLQHILSHFLYPVAIVAGILYLWAAVIFVILRYTKNETEWELRHFLEEHYRLFTFKVSSVATDVITPDMVRKQGYSRGWRMALLPLFLSLLGIDIQGLLIISIGILFFGGLFIAYSWYGLRCFRLLKIDRYAK